MTDYSDIKSTGGMDPRNSIDEAMYRLTVQQRDDAWREVRYWQQKCDVMLESLNAMRRSMVDIVNTCQPTPKLLAHAESFEAGRVMERDGNIKAIREVQAAYDKQHGGGPNIEGSVCSDCIGAILARAKQ